MREAAAAFCDDYRVNWSSATSLEGVTENSVFWRGQSPEGQIFNLLFSLGAVLLWKLVGHLSATFGRLKICPSGDSEIEIGKNATAVPLPAAILPFGCCAFPARRDCKKSLPQLELAATTNPSICSD